MRKFLRAALLSTLVLLSLLPVTLNAPGASAGAVPAAASKSKKNNKSKPRKSKKILKGHHGKHKSKPA